MGYYIQTESHKQKADQLVRVHGAEIIDKPTSFEQIPDNKALVCVVQNALFDAAGLAYSADEFHAFSCADDYRVKTWLLMERDLAYKLAGFVPK
jgi:hypothetical protein